MSFHITDTHGCKIFMVEEVDLMEQLVKFVDPIIDFGDYDIRPVLNLTMAIENLSNN